MLVPEVTLNLATDTPVGSEALKRRVLVPCRDYKLGQEHPKMVKHRVNECQSRAETINSDETRRWRNTLEKQVQVPVATLNLARASEKSAKKKKKKKFPARHPMDYRKN